MGTGEIMQIFFIYFFSHSIKIQGGTSAVAWLDLRQLSGNSVDGFVGQIFRNSTSPASEYGDQLATDEFIDLAGGFRVRAEPAEQFVECRLVESPVSRRRLTFAFLAAIV